jgi:hypothetical protein
LPRAPFAHPLIILAGRRTAHLGCVMR